MARNPFGWDLPAGCSQRDIDLAMGADEGEEDCETCDSTGKVEGDTCPDCDGEGIVCFSISERRQAQREEWLEQKADMDRDESRI